MDNVQVIRSAVGAALMDSVCKAEISTKWLLFLLPTKPITQQDVLEIQAQTFSFTTEDIKMTCTFVSMCVLYLRPSLFVMQELGIEETSIWISFLNTGVIDIFILDMLCKELVPKFNHLIIFVLDKLQLLLNDNITLNIINRWHSHFIPSLLSTDVYLALLNVYNTFNIDTTVYITPVTETMISNYNFTFYYDDVRTPNGSAFLSSLLNRCLTRSEFQFQLSTYMLYDSDAVLTCLAENWSDLSQLCFLSKEQLNDLKPFIESLSKKLLKIFCLTCWNIPGLYISFNPENHNISWSVEFVLKAILSHCSNLDKLLPLFFRISGVTGYMSSQIRAFSLLSRHNPIKSLHSAMSIPDVFNWVLYYITNLDLAVDAPISVSTALIKTLFRKQGLPTTIRRLLFQLLSQPEKHCKLSIETTTMVTQDSPNPLLLNPRVNLQFVPSVPNGAQLRFFRHQKRWDKPAALRKYIGTDISPEVLSVRFVGEEALGPAVFKEILDIVWEEAVYQGWISLVDDNTESVCIAVGDHLQYADDAFALGFFSALCIVRGLHMPLRLSKSFWEYLFFDDNMSVPYHRMFARTNQYFIQCNKYNQLSDENFCNLVGLDYNDNIRNLDRENILSNFFIPNKSILREFKNGWQTFITTSFDVEKVNPSDLFCLPLNTQINFENFLKVFTQVTPDKDCHFKDYASRLSNLELKYLVSFITGSPRLPNVIFNENKISVIWTPAPYISLPTAQNCTNTVILNCDPKNLVSYMRPIMDFDTVFGYL